MLLSVRQVTLGDKKSGDEKTRYHSAFPRF
jgi:hypothetical protein